MLGWVEGGNLQMDYRFAGSDLDGLATYAEELVNLRPDLILAVGGPAARAVQQRTSVIPIVFGAADPAQNGLVANISRPGGNITGFAGTFISLYGKWLELFKEAVPGLTRVAHVFPANQAIANPRNEFRTTRDAAAARLGVTIVTMAFRDVAEIEPAISAFAAAPHGGLLVTGATARAHLDTIERLALHYRLPLMRQGGLEEGVLISHGIDRPDAARLIASYVDRILRGAKPGDLPVQFPTKFELAVNLKIARTLGIEIPPTLLAIADEVIG
jgi:putative ABC transport system substrate-binding protein